MSESNPNVLENELARLGEEPPSDLERRRFGLDAANESEADEDVRTVAALVDLSQSTEPVAELSDLDRARAWRQVERRIGAGRRATGVEGGASSRRSWVFVAAGIAAAAAVLAFVLARPTPEVSDDGHEVAVGLGTQARAGLAALGVAPGAESRRAQDMLSDYEARLSSREGAG